jgi:hypothetical protein
MEINLNTNIDSVTRTNGFITRGREVGEAKAQVSFEDSTALNRALATVSDVRSELVQRAQVRVLGSVPYPPEETVSKIAHLLALNFGETQ